MACYVVRQSFFNPGIGAEGTLGEYLEMSESDALRIGERYLDKVSKSQQEALKERRIRPRIVSLAPVVDTEWTEKTVITAPNKMVRGGKKK